MLNLYRSFVVKLNRKIIPWDPIDGIIIGWRSYEYAHVGVYKLISWVGWEQIERKMYEIRRGISPS